MQYMCTSFYHIHGLFKICGYAYVHVHPKFYCHEISYIPQECQAVRTELKRTVAEKESKVQEYAQSLLRAEEAIAVKEKEKSELVESFHKTRLESLQDSQHADVRSIEDKCAELQLQLDDVSYIIIFLYDYTCTIGVRLLL